MGPNSILYTPNTLTESVVNFQSQLETGGCLVTSGSQLMVPVDPVGDLAAEFTPPFHFVTASQVQEASVPLLGSWSQLLLALALVLAFGGGSHVLRLRSIASSFLPCRDAPRGP